MAVTIVIGLPSLYAVTVIGLILALTAYFSYHAGRLSSDRNWSADIRKRAASTIDAKWYRTDTTPPVLNRVDAQSTIFRRHPYREEGFEWQKAA